MGFRDLGIERGKVLVLEMKIVVIGYVCGLWVGRGVRGFGLVVIVFCGRYVGFGEVWRGVG